MIVLDADSPVPPYEQIRSQFAASIGTAELVAGTKLPTVRGLADDLGLAANTVAKAYRELEQRGVIETRGRAGSVVTAGGSRARERMRAEAERYAALVRELAVSHAEALRYVESALDARPGTP